MVDENNIWDLLPAADMVTQDEDEANQRREELEVAEVEETPIIEEVESDADVLLNELWENLDKNEKDIINIEEEKEIKPQIIDERSQSGVVQSTIPTTTLPTKIGNIAVEKEMTTEEELDAVFNPTPPKETNFYKETEEKVEAVNEVMEQPVLNQYGTLDVEATTNKVNEIIETAPPLVGYNITQQELGDLQTTIPPFFISDDEELDTTQYYTPNREALDYIKNLIIAEDFSKFETWDEFVENSETVLRTAIQNDPIIQAAFKLAQAQIKKESEGLRGYQFTREAQENGELDTPEGLLAAQARLDKWAQDRYNELFYTPDVESRVGQYKFLAQKALKELYKPFGRTKEEELAQLDEDYFKEGKYLQWKLRDAWAGTKVSVSKMVKQLQTTFSRPDMHQRDTIRNFFNDNKELLEKSGILNLTTAQLREKMADREYWATLPDVEKSAFQKAYSYASASVNYLAKGGEAREIREKNTINDLLKGTDDYKGFQQYDKEATKDIFKLSLEIMQDEHFESLLNELETGEGWGGLQELGFIDTAANFIKQLPQMGPMIGGGILERVGKTVPGPWGKGMQLTGKGLTLLGAGTIMATEMTSMVYETMKKNIINREGEGHQITVEDIIAELEDPESIDMIHMLIASGAIAGLEKLGIDAIFGAYATGGRTLASLYRGELYKFIKGVGRTYVAAEIAGASEAVTEGFQGYISDATVRLQTGEGWYEALTGAKFDWEGARVGRAIGQVLPVVGKFGAQTTLEINQMALDVVEKFDMHKLAPTMHATATFFTQANDRISKLVENGKITKEEGRIQKDQLSELRNAGLRIPQNIDGRTRPRLIRLLLEQDSLEKKIKEVNNKDISSPEIERLKIVSEEISGIALDAAAKTEYLRMVGNVKDAINGKVDGKLKYITAKDKKGVEKQIDRLKKDEWNLDKKSSSNYGSIFQKGDQQVIILNQAEALKDGAVNTAAHEFLHAVIYNTVKNSKGTALALGNNLLQYLEKINPDLMKNGDFAERVRQYQKDPTISDETKAEEVLTLFSEAVLDGALTLNEGALTQIGDFFRRIWQSLGFGNIRFDTGEDIYKFIKDYNKNISRGKTRWLRGSESGVLSKAQERLLDEGAEGDLVKRKYRMPRGKEDKAPVIIKPSTKKLTELTKEFKDGNFDNVEDLTKQYQATGRDALKRWAAERGMTINLGNPQVNEEVTSLLNKEFNSFTKNFDPSKKVEASTYIQNIAKRIGPEIAKEGARKARQVSQDVLTEKGRELKAEETQETTDKEFEKRKYPTDIAAIEKQTADVRPEILTNIKNSVKQFIASSVGKVKEIGGKGKKIITKLNPSSLAKELKAQNTATRIAVRNAMGKSVKAQNDFIKKAINDGYIETIPIAAMKKRFRTVKGFNIEKIGRETLGAGTGIYKLSGLNKQALIDFYTKDQSGRRSFIDLLAKGLTIEQFQEAKIDTEFMKDLDFKLKEAKSELTAEEFMNEVERIYDGRTKEKRSLDVVKASKKRQRSYQQVGLKTAARTKMSYMVDLISPDTIERKRKWNDKDEKSYRKTRTMHYHYTMGSQMIKNYMYGSNTDIYGQKGAKLAKQELNEPLTKEEIEVLEEMGVPTVVRKGKTYYDQSKAPKNTVDEMVTIDGKEYSVLALSIKEQTGTIKRNKKTTKISYANWSSKKRRQKLNDPEWREYQAAKLRVLKKIAKLIESDLKANPTNKNFWGTWLNGSQNNAAHPVRALAPIEFLHYRKLPNARMEHTLPANQVGTMIMKMALDGKVDEDFNFIEKDYFQGDISLFNDDLLKTMLDASGQKVNLKTDMPTLFFDIKNPTTWMRYVEKIVWASRTGGINMNEILVWDSKQNKIVTLTEQFGLSLTESEYKYKDGKNTNFGLIRFQNNLLYDVFRGKMTMPEAKARLDVAVKSGIKLVEQIQVEYNGKMLAPGVLPTEATPEYAKDVMLDSAETKVNAFKASKKRKGISVFDFDDTIAKTKEKVIVYAPAFKPGTSQEISMKLTPAEFAERAQQLEDMGASFDFSQFEKVKGAKKGPLADLALKRQGKFGSKDIFILTARPQIAATGIKKFLDGIGLNIPLENITGLEKGTPQAKVEWILNKTAEGYNDFYFADDSLANVKGVKNILEAVDVKNKVFQAKASKKRNLDKEFNKILEETTGLKAKAKYSPVRARLEGKKKDKGVFKWLGRQLTITPSAEDFLGLMQDLMGYSKQGNRHAKWIQDNLIGPYNKAEQTILSAKVAVANDFAALKNAFPSLKSTIKGNPLMDQIGVGVYTKSQAMRVYIWNKQGMEIPGLSKRDQNALVAAVEADSELNVFADEVILIQKDKQYPAPTYNWVGGTIDSDIMSGIDKTFRRQVMTEFDENVKIIFSQENMFKLEALFGKKWIDALKDSLRRMHSGSNRPVYQGGGARIVNEMLDWLNGSVGAVMFLNMKSGLLQLISNVNFINWGDNNIYAAAKAFASKEYWPTVMKLMNSDYLVNRRDGLRINVNEAELANAAKDGGMKGTIAYLLDKGFIITRIMDSLAIATGGATFYINRRNALLKRQNPDTGKKYTQVEAETKAFDDFYAISEKTQQSSNPSKISQQQASLFGRVILAFQNVTMQYNRETKKSIRDLYNRRKSPGMTQRESDLGNLSKIIYYTTVQNIVFNALQQALFAMLFDDEGDEKEKNRAADIAHGMADSLLFGLGFGGAAISTVKNVLRVVMQESDKKSPDYEEAVWEIFNVSPVLDSKIRKLRTTAKTFSWNREEIAKRGWSLDNPVYLAISQLISAGTNIPIDRVLRKIMNMRMAMDEETRTWQRVALMLGWSSWSVGLPYWGLQSTIDQEEIAIEKAKKDYKNDIRKLKAQGYKKVMYRNLEDYDPKSIIEMQSPAGTVVYYAKNKLPYKKKR